MNIALVLSGGIGTRLPSRLPKQYIPIGGRMMVIWTLETLYSHEEIDAVQIVAAHEWHSAIRREQELHLSPGGKFRGFSLPGENRQLSILNGLRDIVAYAGDEDVVMVQDAVRPLLEGRQISDCLAALRGHDGVMPVLPMKDTVYYSHNGKQVSRLLERSQIFAGQAPEFFLLGKYLRANEALLPDRILSINGSTEPAILAGMDIAMVPGDEMNFKVTTAADMERYLAFLASESA